MRQKISDKESPIVTLKEGTENQSLFPSKGNKDWRMIY